MTESFAEVTDLELFVSLYNRFGIDCKITRDEDEDLQIIVFAGNKLQEKSYSDAPTYSPKFFGWGFIVSRIAFDLKGKFIKQIFIDDFEEDEDIVETTAAPWNEDPKAPLVLSNGKKQTMKYIYRDNIIFEYIDGKVIQHKIDDRISAFDYCRWITEDYKLLAQFFDTVHRHKTGECVELKDIVVY